MIMASTIAIELERVKKALREAGILDEDDKLISEEDEETV